KYTVPESDEPDLLDADEPTQPCALPEILRLREEPTSPLIRVDRIVSAANDSVPVRPSVGVQMAALLFRAMNGVTEKLRRYLQARGAL
ncbi:MAG: hypothetical protein AAF658_14440, partial [Myxococcota bacterium]